MSLVADPPARIENKTLTFTAAKSRALTDAASTAAGHSKRKRFHVGPSHFSSTSPDLCLCYRRMLVPTHSHKASEEIKMNLRRT